MNVGRSARRVAAFVTHNWPLKLAAIVLATLLYAGLFASQGSNTYPGPIQVTAANLPAGTVVTNQLRPIEEIRYLAPADKASLTAEDFRATVDLSSVDATGEPASVRVDVVPTDPRVTILEVRPRTIPVVLDEKLSATVPVWVALGPLAVGIEAGETVLSIASATVTGASAAVKRVVAVRVSVALDPGGLDFDRDVQADPIDKSGEVVQEVDVEPRMIHVVVPLFTNKQSRTLPVNPVVTGAPAPGFRISGVEVTPLVVSVEGDAEQLTSLAAADTAPISVFGATRDVTTSVALALPPGVLTLRDGSVTVVVRVEPVTETRTFTAGFRLDGREPLFLYEISGKTVLLTLYGSVATLDRLAAAPLVVGLNVAGLEPGVHEVAVVPSLPTGVTVAALAPETVSVTITDPATRVSPSPAPPSVVP